MCIRINYGVFMLTGCKWSDGVGWQSENGKYIEWSIWDARLLGKAVGQYAYVCMITRSRKYLDNNSTKCVTQNLGSKYLVWIVKHAWTAVW